MDAMADNTTTEENLQPSFLSRLQQGLKRQFQTYLDAVVPHTALRWVALGLLMLGYCARVYYLQGFYIVTYGLGIFLLNLLIGFLSPIEEEAGDGPVLPTSSGDEYKPFVRRLPEFKFWYSSARAVCLAFLMTFFPVFNIPVFWPILLIYFVVLFFLTMKRQIKHMIKHKYIPFDIGKKKYAGKPKPHTAASALEDSRAK